MVLPAAYQQQGLIAAAVKELVEVEKLANVGTASAPQIQQLKQISELISKLAGTLEAFESLAAKLVGEEDIHKKARGYADQIVPAMADIRAVCDKLEEVVADEFWPLPKYREMLFLS